MNLDSWARNSKKKTIENYVCSWIIEKSFAWVNVLITLARHPDIFNFSDQFETQSLVFAFVVIYTFSFSRSIWFCVVFIYFSLCIISMTFCKFSVMISFFFYYSFQSYFCIIFFNFSVVLNMIFFSFYLYIEYLLYQYLYAFFPILCVCDNPHKYQKKPKCFD